MPIKDPTLNRPFIEQGKRLKAVMNEYGIKPKDLIKDLNYSNAAISRYHNGVSRTPPKLLNFLQQRFGISLAWYVNGTGPKKLSAEAPKMRDVAQVWRDVNILQDKVDSLIEEVSKMAKIQYNQTKKIEAQQKEIEQLKNQVSRQLV